MSTRVKTVLFFVCLCVFILSGGFPGDRPCQAADAQKDPYRGLKLFTDVLSIVRDHYVDEVKTGDLIQGAINGMLLTLDPHSAFMTPEAFQEMQIDTRGEFGGIGIEITIRDNVLTVVSPIEDTPADRAGLMAGDQIVKIGDKPTKDMTLLDAVRMMRGAKGTHLTITIMRDASPTPREFTLVREIVKIRSVRSKLLGEGIGYIRIAQFQENTAEELKKGLEEMRRRNGAVLSGLILDLRNDPGGLLDQAVKVVDLFLKEGLIVYTEGRDDQSRMRFLAQDDGNEPSCPMVTLINGGSASASEIVAGALQDHRRAVLLGTPSFGKGSVQTVIPLADNYGLRLTTALYYTPSGRSIQAKGITPDILVHPLQAKEVERPVFREEDLDHHLDPGKEKPGSGTGKDRGAFTLSPQEQEDYQLMRALDLLKGWRLLKGLNQGAA